MMAMPLAVRSATMPYSRSISFSERAEVGSSMMITRASKESALAISTTCCTLTLNLLASVLGSSSRPSRVKIARVSA